MFYTKFKTTQIIHPCAPELYSSQEGYEMFQYSEYIEVEFKPTLEHAEIVWAVCSGRNLCVGRGRRGKTEELTASKCPSVND